MYKENRQLEGVSGPRKTEATKRVNSVRNSDRSWRRVTKAKVDGTRDGDADDMEFLA